MLIRTSTFSLSLNFWSQSNWFCFFKWKCLLLSCLLTFRGRGIKWSLQQRHAEFIHLPSSPVPCSCLGHRQKEQRRWNNLGSPHSGRVIKTISLSSSSTSREGRELEVLLRTAMTWKAQWWVLGEELRLMFRTDGLKSGFKTLREVWDRNQAGVQIKI